MSSRRISICAVFILLLPSVAANGLTRANHKAAKKNGEEFAQGETSGVQAASRYIQDRRNLGKIDSVIDGKWQQFRHWSVGSQALTCGTACIPGVNSDFAPPAPWSFSLPPGGGCFIVVDAFEMNEQFNVTDFGNITIGTTSKPRGARKCGKYPDFCYDAPGVSKGAFFLEEGQHSAMIIVAQGGAGSAFFRVTTNTSLCINEISPAPSSTTPLPSAPVAVPSFAPTPSPLQNTLSRTPTGTSSYPPFPTSTPSNTSRPKNRPPLAKCKKSITLSAKKDCATRVSINEGSYDPDGDVMKMRQSPWGPYPVGTTNVTLLVTDSAGNSDSCFTEVTVIDFEEINEDKIDCGIADWHVQLCDSPITMSASYNVPAAPKPSTKTNGCPVKIAISSDSAASACERCVGQASENQIAQLNCRNVISISENELTLRQSKAYGFLMSWQVVATDGRGRLVTKRCGVCMENPSECQGAPNTMTYLHNNNVRNLARVFKCPAELPTSEDGSKVWPAQSLAEINNCAALLKNQ